MSNYERLNVAVLCGGTGGAMVMRGLPPSEVDRTAEVNVVDDGGDTGRMIKEGLIDLGVGDQRNVTHGMSTNEELVRLYEARNALGHCHGNMRIAELANKHGSFKEGVKQYGYEHEIDGLVLPITTEPHVLTMQDGGTYVEGEHEIGHRKFLTLFPTLGLRSHSGQPVVIDPESEAALLRADLIVIAPGNPWGSIMPTMIVEGVPETLAMAKAPKLMFANVLDTIGQSTGGHAMDQLDLYDRTLGLKVIDAIAYNTDLPDAAFLSESASPNQRAMRVDERGFGGRRRDIHRFAGELLSRIPAVRDENDTLISRSRIRNNSEATGRLILEAARELGARPAKKAA